MDKEYKICIFCKNKFYADRPIDVCERCLEIISTPEDIRKDIEDMEKINCIVEEEAKEELKSLVSEFLI